MCRIPLLRLVVALLVLGCGGQKEGGADVHGAGGRATGTGEHAGSSSSGRGAAGASGTTQAGASGTTQAGGSSNADQSCPSEQFEPVVQVRFEFSVDQPTEFCSAWYHGVKISIYGGLHTSLERNRPRHRLIDGKRRRGE